MIIGKNTEIRKHINKLIKLIFLLVFWSFALVFVCSIGAEKLTIKKFFVYVFDTKIGSRYMGVLWYLQSLIAIYIVYPIINYVYINQKRLFYYLFYIVGFFSVGIKTVSILFDYICSYGGSAEIYKIVSFINRLSPFSDVSFLFYFLLGRVVKDYNEVIKEKRTKLIIAGIAAWIIAFYIGMTISRNNNSVYAPSFNYGSLTLLVVLLSCYALIMNLKIRNKRINNILASIGSNTLGVYLLHIVYITYLNRLIPNTSFFVRFGKLWVVFLCSYLTVIIIRKIPIVCRVVRV